MSLILITNRKYCPKETIQDSVDDLLTDFLSPSNKKIRLGIFKVPVYTLWYFQPIGWKDPTQTVCATDSFERSDSSGIGIPTVLCSATGSTTLLRKHLTRTYLTADMLWASLISVQFSFSNILCSCTYVIMARISSVGLCDVGRGGWVEFAVITADLSSSLRRGNNTCVAVAGGTTALSWLKRPKNWQLMLLWQPHTGEIGCIYLHCDTLMLLTFV